MYLSFFPSLDLMPLFTDVTQEMSIAEMLLFLFSKIKLPGTHLLDL